MRTQITIGNHEPPLKWIASVTITISPNQWMKIVKEAKDKGKEEAFTKWMRGKLILFSHGRKLPESFTTTLEEVE